MDYRQWPFAEAAKVRRRIELEHKKRAVLESGYGPSGLPHIGTFGEAVRTSFVVRALRILAPELETRFITFSDDMDGLSTLPENVPNHQMLSRHLGKPLCRVPDPYGEFDSFAANMNNRLKKYLDSFRFRYEFTCSSQMYEGGTFNQGLSLVMKYHKQIIDISTSAISKERREFWSPFLPICGNCGKITTTRVLQHDAGSNEVAYRCANIPRPEISPCGYEGRTSIFDGHVKVGWKVDWALRWFSLGVDYEMYGEDLIDSFRVSDKVVSVLGGRAPVTLKYELFRDEFGRKISKKLGNGVALEEWLEYAPSGALLYFLYTNPNHPKRMSLSLMPKLVDEYLNQMGEDNGTLDSPFTFIGSGADEGPIPEAASLGIDYSLIVNLVDALNLNKPEAIMEYLTRYDSRVKEPGNSEFFGQLVDKAIKYVDRVRKPERKRVQPQHDFDSYLCVLASRLKELKTTGKATPDVVQTLCFGIAQEYGLSVKDWFRFLYRVMLHADSGPRIGTFICLYGIDETIGRIEAHSRCSK